MIRDLQHEDPLARPGLACRLLWRCTHVGHAIPGYGRAIAEDSRDKRYSRNTQT